MIKAVFFDIDGTLVSFSQKFLSDRLLADLAALRERGIKIFLSTGRALQDLETTGMLRGARFDGYVTINGQFCCDGDGKTEVVPRAFALCPKGTGGVLMRKGT